jgi:protein involved in polysaccharide export with SLBB domain
MFKKLLLFLLISCSLCAGQSAPAPAPAAPSDNPQGAALSAQESQASSGSAVLKGAASEPGAEEKTAVRPPEAARPIKAAFARSDFELFAEDAAGHALPVYGRELFEGVPSTFAPVDRVPVPANYVLGPGDELLVRAWGRIEMDVRVIVDRNGQISLPKVGVISVAGLRYEQLEGFLHSSIGALYKDFDLSVTLGQLRSIQVFVLGNARQPGVYTLGSLSTLVNALFASGGPSATGSMRHIQLRRGDRLVTEFDIYDLQQRGDKSHDVQLLPGDVIFIPTIGPQVALIGNVSRPAIYELKGDTTIASALAGAGGLTTMAGAGRALLERIENHRRRRIDEFDLDPASQQRLLRDGDLLRIFAISQQFENAVTLRGNVALPGRYAWRDGMRVSDLIPSRNFLITASHWDQQNHLDRNASPDIMANILVADAEIDWDYAAIERLDDHDLSTRLIPFNLGNALDHPDSADNQPLKVGDVITVFSRKDIVLPIDKHASFVRIGGEVNAPGVYRVDPGDNLRSLLQRAGGPTPHAYLYGSVLTRISARQVQQEEINQSIARLQKQIASSSAGGMALASSGGSNPLTQSNAQTSSQLPVEQALIAQLAATKPIGRVVLDIKSNATSVADIPDMELEDGDVLLIPARLSTVQVMGSVYNENAFRYQPKKQLYAYLNDAGGATREADTRRIFLVRADGTLISRNMHRQLWHGNFEKIALLPGDAIIVPERFKTFSPFWTTTFPAMTQMLSQTALTGAVMGTLF